MPKTNQPPKPKAANQALRDEVIAASKLAVAFDREVLVKNFGLFFKDAWEHALEPHSKFNDSWHYELLFEYAQLVGTGEFKKRFPDKKGLIVCIPPRTLKTKIFNIGLPAWIWTFAPWKKFLCLSYGAELAIPISQDRRNLLQSRWFEKRWPKLEIKDDANEKGRYMNEQGGYCFSSGTVATGFGGNVIICDDMLNARYAYSKLRRQQVNKFWDDALTTRRNNAAEDVYIIVAQRLHSNDLIGHLLSKEAEEWVVLNIPMEADETTEYTFPLSGKVHVRPKGDVLVPAMNTPQYIRGEKRNPKKWTSQFQQRPSPPGGFIFNPDKWAFYNEAPDPDFQILTVDCTWKSGENNDKVALMVIGVEGPRKYILAWKHEHMSYNQTLDAIREFRKLYPRISYVLVEKAANGEAVLRQLGEEMPGMIGVLPQDSKEARAHAASADLESGQCYVLNPEKDLRVQSEIIDTFADFQGDGSVEFDDLIDAFTQAINWLRQRFWSMDHVDKAYAELQDAGKPGPKAGDLCPACSAKTVVREGSAWACTTCKSRGRGNSMTLNKTGF